MYKTQHEVLHPTTQLNFIFLVEVMNIAAAEHSFKILKIMPILQCLILQNTGTSFTLTAYTKY